MGARRIAANPAAHATTSGTTVDVASAFANTRLRQSDQKPSLLWSFNATKPASRNDDVTVAMMTPNSTNSATLPMRSKRNGELAKCRNVMAPISASLVLLTNQHSTIGSGVEPTCTSRCAGSAAITTAGHVRTGSSRNAANSSALGIQNDESGRCEYVSSIPTRAPT